MAELLPLGFSRFAIIIIIVLISGFAKIISLGCCLVCEVRFTPDGQFLKKLQQKKKSTSFTSFVDGLRRRHREWTLDNLPSMLRMEIQPKTWILAYLSALVYVHAEGKYFIANKQRHSIHPEYRSRAGEHAMNSFLEDGNCSYYVL